ncbi:winged helix-turn-helix domain-containing protein [Nguyenibacter vanlangensis]|uniref:Winged helix-turn-helix domain-containing protein n=1 Tax=Nguyenibacter vanlangensis TaxID=1216886 RepID=A0ABZ3D9N1_9PROT
MTNSYLKIAEEVLKNERRPLSPRAIIAEAYKSGIVPCNLYGKTQHKTLGARMSEDIISKRDRSQFYRTSPGKYFLRDFLNDPAIPEDLRQPYQARRRLRELVRGPTLAIMSGRVTQLASSGLMIEPSRVLRLLVRGVHTYINPRKGHEGFYVVRPFVCVFKGTHVLTYRVGRYRDNRDNFFAKRSIGFSTLVTPHDQTLFNAKDAGILDVGVRATMIDLDILCGGADSGELSSKAELHKFVLSHDEPGTGDLLAVVSMECPTWFEPTRRRLALNDLEWMDIRNRVNNIDDFDPWSRSVLEAFYTGTRVFGRKH